MRTFLWNTCIHLTCVRRVGWRAQTHPGLQIILYISGSGGLMERMAGCGPDIVSVDQRVDMRDAIARIGPDFAVQVSTSGFGVIGFSQGSSVDASGIGFTYTPWGPTLLLRTGTLGQVQGFFCTCHLCG